MFWVTKGGSASNDVIFFTRPFLCFPAGNSPNKEQLSVRPFWQREETDVDICSKISFFKLLQALKHYRTLFMLGI